VERFFLFAKVSLGIFANKKTEEEKYMVLRRGAVPFCLPEKVLD
jgi:hypothetical protein